MSDKDDPFGLSNDAGRTRIRPVRSDRAQGPGTAAIPPGTAQAGSAPGGAWGGQDAAPASRAMGGFAGAGHVAEPTGTPRLRSARAHPNPLVAAFAGLLELAPELERAVPPAQPQALKARLHDSLIDARDSAVGSGVALTRANQAAWFVAALLDDIALNTPWGGHSDWPRQPLVTQISGEVDAGTRFFDRLDDLVGHPNRDAELLEIAYLCVALGFRGKFRVQPGAGEGALTALRAQAARALRDRGTADAALSPHWQGVTAPDTPRRFIVPLWTVGLLAVALIAAIYTGLSMQLSSKAEELFVIASRVPPADRADIFRPVRETVAPPPEITVSPPPVLELLPEFRAALPADAPPALKGKEDASLTFLVLQGTNPEVFRSAKADLNDVYVPLVAAIAKVIADNREVIGAVTVVGHTDNVPVQRTNPFASNQGLSEARAATVAKALVAGGVPADIVRSEGHADTEPVGDNATKDGRAQNRRIEIKIEKKL